MSKEIINNTLIILYGHAMGNHNDKLDINMRLDPKAWTRKYFTAASVSLFELWIIINGINDKRLISILAHKKSQFELDIAIRVLIIIINAHMKLNGRVIIKI